MSRVAYVNGRYLAHGEAAVHIEDRGYQFADGVYDACAVLGGAIVDRDLHLDRLERSLGELRIRLPMPRRSLEVVLREVVRRNRVGDGLLYFQVTRGVARRDHAFPADAEPALVVTARSGVPGLNPRFAEEGVKVATCPDIRWSRCDIKTVSLVANVLAKQQAREAGAFEAWQVDHEGLVTEGTSSNAWIVDTDGHLVTRQADQAILNGITRRVVLGEAERLGLSFHERPFSVDEAKSAREAFLTSATSFILPVVQVDEAVIGNGKPGSIVTRLRAKYLAHALDSKEVILS